MEGKTGGGGARAGGSGVGSVERWFIKVPGRRIHSFQQLHCFLLDTLLAATHLPIVTRLMILAVFQPPPSSPWHPCPQPSQYLMINYCNENGKHAR